MRIKDDDGGDDDDDDDGDDDDDDEPPSPQVEDFVGPHCYSLAISNVLANWARG